MTTNTMVAIQTITVTGSAAPSVTFASIPQTYTDLIVIADVQGQSAGCGPTMYFNTDNASGNYSNTVMYTDGSTTKGSVRNTNSNIIDITTTNGLPYSSTSLYAPVTAHIMNYAKTSSYKSGLFEYRNTTGGYNGGGDISKAVFTWRSTAAITSITLANNNGKSIPVGSTYTLYGIANADTGAYATGGIITQDSTYYYHAFGSSGTFTPSRELTADILVVAGGGGGVIGQEAVAEQVAY